MSDGPAAGTDGPAEKKSLANRFVAMISSIFHPLLWALAGIGLLKALVATSVTFGWLDPETSTGVVLNALSDAFIYFLPVALAVSAAKYFDAQQFTSLAIAGSLVYPAISALNGADGLTFFGVPMTMVGYAYSVIPIIATVWIQSHIERFLYAKLPAILRRFVTPMLVVLILVPFVFLLIGPVSATLTGWVAGGINAVFQNVPWLGGAILGGTWQLLTVFGVHSGFTPFFIADYQEFGYGRLLAPMFGGVLAQTAAFAGVWVRSKRPARKTLAATATASGLLAGVTEPGIYGVSLPLRRPFIFGLIGGAVGGGIISAAGVATNAAIVFPSLLSVPALTGNGDLVFALVGIGTGMALGFGLTVIFGFTDPDEETTPENTAPKGAAAPSTDTTILSPLSGTAIPLDQVADPVFAGGAMGKGAAIVPSIGAVLAPFDGVVKAVFPTGHAIGLRSDTGAEVLIHIGLNTVKLNGKHFVIRVEQGQSVTAGDVLVEFDQDAIKAEGYDLTTPVIVTNAKQFPSIGSVRSGLVSTGEPLYLAIAVEQTASA